ncbi:MAG TPA: class I SAM-dependent methyltransferase [Micropepsaceae bacterium]|nr:class I SAM-dependent methyltransferase [Micropepsaceae bacterium]
MSPRQQHWEEVYRTKAADKVSWYQPNPAPSLEMIYASEIARGAAIIDVGGGASMLADALLDAGFLDISVLDIAASALDISKSRLSARARDINWIVADVLTWKPSRAYDLWHDRAVFHFLTATEDRARYRAILEKGLKPGGTLVIATFAEDGPEKCSGLPVQRWSPDSLAAELGPQFKLEQHFREAHHTPWDSVQAFTWCRFKYL